MEPEIKLKVELTVDGITILTGNFDGENCLERLEENLRAYEKVLKEQVENYILYANDEETRATDEEI